MLDAVAVVVSHAGAQRDVRRAARVVDQGEPPLRLAFHAGFSPGDAVVEGDGLLNASMRAGRLGRATWGAHLSVDLVAHLRLGARLEAVLPLSRPRYLVNQTEVVHEVPSASVRLGVSLASTFGTP